MKRRGFFALTLSITMLLSACSSTNGTNNTSVSPSASAELTSVGTTVWPSISEELASEDTIKAMGQIFLYGEYHGEELILDKEFELWSDYYHNEGMRHLFVEYPYYTAEFLNLWMQEDNDDILDELFRDLAGTAADTPANKEFYQNIKIECPETVFHGTDVGHQYDSTGARCLAYLSENGMEDSEQYSLARENIEQGEYYYANEDDVYRENMMTENFIREFEKLNGECIMGIYGGAHTGLDDMDYNTQSVLCMASQLKERYGEIVHSEDLTAIAKDIEPLRIDTITVNGKEYQASYFGEEDLSTWTEDYASREFWRLEDAYDDFKDMAKSEEVLPYNNYPILIETGQVFVIDYMKKDGSIERKYYRSDGDVWMGMESTAEFEV